MKARRQAAILDVVDQEEVRSQEQLRQRLAQRGFDVTQATLSRDIKELGLMKRSSDGAYQAAGAGSAPPPTTIGALGRALAEFLINIEPVQQLVVLKTGAGQAQLLAVAIDRARMEEVAGTLAGDDTILIVARDPKNAQQVVKKFKELAR